jgi:hypothetical protein
MTGGCAQVERTTEGLVLSVIWLISSAGSHQLHYFWPAWVIGPPGAVLLARTICGRNKPPHS